MAFSEHSLGSAGRSLRARIEPLLEMCGPHSLTEAILSAAAYANTLHSLHMNASNHFLRIHSLRCAAYTHWPKHSLAYVCRGGLSQHAAHRQLAQSKASYKMQLMRIANFHAVPCAVKKVNAPARKHSTPRGATLLGEHNSPLPQEKSQHVAHRAKLHTTCSS